MCLNVAFQLSNLNLVKVKVLKQKNSNSNKKMRNLLVFFGTHKFEWHQVESAGDVSAFDAFSRVAFFQTEMDTHGRIGFNLSW